MKFKDRLKKAREDLGYSQSKLAILSGVSISAIGSYETGVIIKIGDKQIEKLAKALNVSKNWLKDGTDIKKESIENSIDRLIDLGVITSSKLDDASKDIVIGFVESYLETKFDKK